MESITMFLQSSNSNSFLLKKYMSQYFGIHPFFRKHAKYSFLIMFKNWVSMSMKVFICSLSKWVLPALEIFINHLISPFGMCTCLIWCQMHSKSSINVFRISDYKLLFQSWDRRYWKDPFPPLILWSVPRAPSAWSMPGYTRYVPFVSRFHYLIGDWHPRNRFCK